MGAAAVQGWVGEALQVPAGPHPQPRVLLPQCGAAALWGLWPGGRQAEKLQGSPGRAVGVLGAWPSRRSRWQHPQGWLCLLVAMVPAGGCVTSKLGSRQTVVCGLKGPGGQPLWAALPAPEGEVHGVLSSLSLPPQSPQGTGQASPSPEDFHQRDHEADTRPKGVSWGHRSGGEAKLGCLSLLQGSCSHQAPHGFQNRGYFPWWAE